MNSHTLPSFRAELPISVEGGIRPELGLTKLYGMSKPDITEDDISIVCFSVADSQDSAYEVCRKMKIWILVF